MSQIKFRSSLGASEIPLVSDFFSRSIVIPQIDLQSPRIPGVVASYSNSDGEQPQIFYAENCMPTAQGMQSIAYTEMIDAAPSQQADFDRLILIRTSVGNKFFFSPANGKSYIYRRDTNTWSAKNTIAPGVFDGFVSWSFLHGRTFICYESTNVYEYDSVTDTFAPVAITGVTVANMLGICAAVNYNILFDATTIYWSNPLAGNETDFTSDPLTGAGSIQVQEAKGFFVAVLPISQGFIIYTTANAVLAQYSGNAQFPWVFREIPGSGGIETPERVTFEANFNFHYAYTTAGLMKLDKNNASPVLPTVTDFLAGRIFEEYNASLTYTLLAGRSYSDLNPTTYSGLVDNNIVEVFTTTYLTNSLDVKLTFCGNRYLVISYGKEPGLYTYAIVFDTILGRWGKLRINHVDCFDYIPVNIPSPTYAMLSGTSYAALSPTTYLGLVTRTTSFAAPGKNIGFLRANGSISVVDFELGNTDSDGVMFVGKFQLLRKNILQISELEVENILANAANFTIAICTSYNGKTFSLITAPVLNFVNGLLRKYGSRVKGENHTIRFTGAFNITYLGLTVVQEGNR